MKQTKVKLAFKGRWIHDEDQLKYEAKKEEHARKYHMAEQKKKKIEAAEKLYAEAQH